MHAQRQIDRVRNKQTNKRENNERIKMRRVHVGWYAVQYSIARARVCIPSLRKVS